MKKGENLKLYYAGLTEDQKKELHRKRTNASTKYFQEHPEELKKRNEAIKANHKGSTGKRWKYPWDKTRFNGNDKEYMAIHHWVYKTLGKARKCEHCSKEASGRQMNWANKSQEYKKEIGDWLQLCPSCHAKYDLNFVSV